MAQIQKQTKAGLAVAAAFALCAFVPTQAAAAPLPAGSVGILAGDIVKLYDGPGTTGGGEFWADVVGKGNNQVGPANASNYDFIAFCLEYNETFSSYGQSLMVKAVSVAAENGGVSGQTAPNYDPISSETAWLYTQAMTNPSVLLGVPAFSITAGYQSTAAKANSLQRAIWFLEGELGAAYTEPQLYTLDKQAQTWVDQAQAAVTSGSWSGIGDVRALNLLKQDGQGNYTLNAQDQLYLQPHTVTTSVPEPETYAMLLAGLGLMGFVARRRKARGSQG